MKRVASGVGTIVDGSIQVEDKDFGRLQLR